MNNNDASAIKHVLHEGNIYIVDYSADVPVWSLAMPLSIWASRQKMFAQSQFPSLHGSTDA